MKSRTERVEEILENTDLLDKLAAEHRVSVYAFGDQAEPRLIETRGGVLDERRSGCCCPQTRQASRHSP